MSKLPGADNSENTQFAAKPQGSGGETSAAAPDFSGPVHWRGNARGETSAEAAAKVSLNAPTMRERVYRVLTVHNRPMTAEQIVRELIGAGIIPANRFASSVPSYRPRCSELADKGLVRDSGVRGEGMCGSNAIAWEIVPEAERENALTIPPRRVKGRVYARARCEAKSLINGSGVTLTDLVAAEIEAYLDQSGDLVELLAFLIAARNMENKSEVNQ